LKSIVVPASKIRIIRRGALDTIHIWGCRLLHCRHLHFGNNLLRKHSSGTRTFV
jgi:hypothetical protein